MKKIILASSSPRRKEILNRFDLKFDIICSNIEEYVDKNDDPIKTVMSLAFEKCQDVANRCNEGDIIIAADTIVYKDYILGKPQNREEALNMIKHLSGDTHLVITGVSIIEVGNSRKIVDYEVTRVKFKDLTKDKIERYLDTEEYKDKAGAYGIQGYGEVLVESIEGSYSNVVGLPIAKLEELLDKNYNIQLL
ncbi:Maf-like protein [Gottschalkia acidurici 9a]|uniref:dTTP/UTP pyrophosphatase n=1 Tax=Gottschalkia acidurici (strain ATCC 7906 / DSM 604 / BCRC 14475 / CIP 104303 / KCTC 5404 / NCIMB 10678 / 9a) TaxID=1128398 RepID=K0AXV2_GOTA9|nr:Maf family protein [Gottschalkia acidurici]AFS78019.1 Maf-like protein [Gottschalkia acidurici 9a]